MQVDTAGEACIGLMSPAVRVSEICAKPSGYWKLERSQDRIPDGQGMGQAY